jgi:hypothetical protein
MEEIWLQQHLCDDVAAPMKIAWSLPFLPTHLISDHFLIGVHDVVQNLNRYWSQSEMCFRLPFIYRQFDPLLL